MRRAFFFIVAIVFATSSFASIPRLSMLDRASEDVSALVAPLSETRLRVSENLAPFERPHESELTRALRQAYEHPSTTNASGLRCFLSVDPVLDLKQAMKNPQGWNRYSYVRNNPLRYTDPTGRQVACANHPQDCKSQEPPPPPPPATTEKKGTVTVGVTVQGTANTLSGSVTAAVNVDRQGEVAGSVTYGRGVTTNPATGVVVGLTGSVTNATSVTNLSGKGTEANATVGRKLGVSVGRVDGPQGSGTYSGGEVTIGAGVQSPTGTFQMTTTWMITKTQVMNAMTNLYARTEQAARDWVMTSMPNFEE